MARLRDEEKVEIKQERKNPSFELYMHGARQVNVDIFCYSRQLLLAKLLGIHDR